MIDQSYINQADLLLQVIPHIAKEKTFALKGGTAINLFLRGMPRLSVDIDLTYLPFVNRETALTSISDSDRSFLLSFKRGNPDWDLFPYAKLKDMPAVQWKLLNLQNLILSNPGKHKELYSKLKTFFSKGA